MREICKRALYNCKNSIYTGAICHNDYFFFLNPCQCEVVIYDDCLNKICCKKTDSYQSITENKKCNYFILSKTDDKDYLYKTTYDFREFDCIKLNVPFKYKENINDIYYDNDEHRIYVVTSNYIYSVTLDGYFIKEESRTYQCNYSERNCCRQSCNSSKKFSAIGKCGVLYTSYIKDNEGILTTLKSDGNFNEINFGEDIKINSIFVCCNKLFLLITKCNKYNYLYELDIKCKNCCHDKLPCHDEPKKPQCPRPCYDPIFCMIESIALEQTALSHILNAEGEKIQKVIADGGNVCELLEVNESVNDTIFNTTMLEHMLQEKLDKIIKYDKCRRKCKK